MKKEFKAILILLLVVTLTNLYTSRIDKQIEQIQAETQELEFRVEQCRAKLDDIREKLQQSKVTLMEQSKVMDEPNFDFVIENKELFEGWTYAPIR